MASHSRLLVTVLLLAPVAFACAKKEEQPPTTLRPASPGAAAPELPPVAASPVATATTPPRPVGAAEASVSGTVRPPATTAPKAPVTTPTTPTAAPVPLAAPTSAPPPTTQAAGPAEKPVAAPPAAPPRPAAKRPRGKITLPAKLGAVTFDHEGHAGKLGIACTTCHHPSRPQKPLASEQQACRDCHTMPATPPMKTSLQAAFHDPRGATGTCIDCHKKKGASAPAKCLECHKK